MTATERRSWMPIGLVLAVIVVGLVTIVLTRPASITCATRTHPTSPVLSAAGMSRRPDPRLNTLAAVVNRWGPPFGKVEGGIGFDYGQWLHLYGLSDSLVAFTKRNAAVTVLDPGLEPRWAVLPATKRIAWDASTKRFILLDLDATTRTRVASIDLTTGRQEWCIDLNSRHRDGQPVSTAFLDDGDLMVVLPVGTGLQLARIEGEDGRVLWSVPAGGAARSDFLGALDSKTVLAGGVEEYRLAEPPPASAGGAVVTAYSVRDGSTTWAWKVPRATLAHVVGVTGDGATDSRVLITVRTRNAAALLALDGHGKQVWQHPLASLTWESTLRSGVVIVRSEQSLAGYDARTGTRLWQRAIPTRATYFPYGFTLDQMPSLDAGHVLMPTTTALRILDVRTGTDVGYPLPTDGINTTYWPYQLVVTPRLLGVVTNTGAILATRSTGG
ncbi:MAG: hypothetical protein JWQ32_2166 [Marmoricola sp.]|nr:hypothetical protein [Marmoricola sp.]